MRPGQSQGQRCRDCGFGQGGAHLQESTARESRRHNAANNVANQKNLMQRWATCDHTDYHHGGKNSNRSKGQMLPGKAEGASVAPQGWGLCLSSASNTPGRPRGTHSFPECCLCSLPTLVNCKPKRPAALEINQQSCEGAGRHGP